MSHQSSLYSITSGSIILYSAEKYSYMDFLYNTLYTRDFQTVGPGPKFGPLTDFFWAL